MLDCERFNHHRTNTTGTGKSRKSHQQVAEQWEQQSHHSERNSNRLATVGKSALPSPILPKSAIRHTHPKSCARRCDAKAARGDLERCSQSKTVCVFSGAYARDLGRSARPLGAIQVERHSLRRPRYYQVKRTRIQKTACTAATEPCDRRRLRRSSASSVGLGGPAASVILEMRSASWLAEASRAICREFNGDEKSWPQ